MSAFDMAVFAAAISFMIPNLAGPSGMAAAAFTDLPMFSPVQAVIFADAAVKDNSVASDTTPISVFIISSLAAASRRNVGSNLERWKSSGRSHDGSPQSKWKVPQTCQAAGSTSDAKRSKRRA
jgi:hypothetical protein